MDTIRWSDSYRVQWVGSFSLFLFPLVSSYCRLFFPLGAGPFRRHPVLLLLGSLLFSWTLSVLITATICPSWSVVMSNPTPAQPTTTFPAPSAAGPVTWRTWSVTCSSCHLWVHKACSGLSKLSAWNPDWVCPACFVTPLRPLPASEPLSPPPSPPYSSQPLPQAPLQYPRPIMEGATGSPPANQNLLLQFNCNGIQHCSRELVALLHERDIGVAAVQETKLTPQSTLPPFNGYTPIRRDRPTGGGGGLLFLVRQDTPYLPLPTDHIFPGDTVIEHLGITITHNSSPLNLINIYIPPPPPALARWVIPRTSHSCLQTAPPMLSSLAISTPTTLTGTHLQGITALQPAETYISSGINNSALCLLNLDTPTRVPSNGPCSSPDLSLASAHLALDLDWATLSTLSSDHLPILISAPSGQSTDPGPRRTFTNFKKANWEEFTRLTEEAIRRLPAPVSCSGGIKPLNDAITRAAKRSIPAGSRREYIPGLNPEAKDALARRDALRVSSPQDPDLPALQSEVSRLINEASREAWRQTVERCDPRECTGRFWTLMRSLSGKRADTPKNQPISFGRQTFTRARDIAKGFCRLFTGAAPPPEVGEGVVSTRQARRRLRHRHRLHSQFAPFTTSLVGDAIKASGTSTASGPDHLTILHLKHLGPIGLEYLTNLFQSLHSLSRHSRVVETSHNYIHPQTLETQRPWLFLPANIAAMPGS